MADNIDRLGPHLTMLIDGECWTFELPQFHDTLVAGWGPGRIGVFEQHRWSDKAVAYWHRRMERHTRTERRWGWVRRIGIPLWTYSHLGWDEDGEDMGRGWTRTSVGRVLADRLIHPEPYNRGSHVVKDNCAEAVALIGTHGVTFTGNIVTGGRTALGLYL
jgi:hypothetical protein